MNKFVATIAIVALASATLSTGAFAKPGGNSNQQIGQQSGGFQSPQIGGLNGFKLKVQGGGDTTSPGDAFFPTGGMGHPRSDCLFAGGTPKASERADGAVIWLCL